MSKFFTSIVQFGGKFCVREVVDGTRKQYVVKDFAPDLYIPSNDRVCAESVDGLSLAKMPCSSVYEAKDLIEQYSDVDGFDIYGTNNWITQFITKNYDEKIEFDSSKIRVFNVDIEVYTGNHPGFPHPEQAACPINLIQLMDSFDVDGLVRVWGCEEATVPEGVDYVLCKDEATLIRKFVEYWEMNCPDVMTGWNIKGFDVPYIMNRTEMVLGEGSCKRFSPWKNVRESKFRSDFGKDQITHLISGVAVLDYIDLYKKYTYANRESYTLDHIGYVELGDKKVDYSDIGTLHGLCDIDFDKFLSYGVQDVRLVDRLDKKMKLLDLVFTLGYMTKQNYTDTFSPVKSWEALIYTHLSAQNRYTKVKGGSSLSSRRIAGAFVKTPVIGKMREWVLSFDLNSLYPHLIAQYNIGAETLVPFEDSPQLGYIPPVVGEGEIRLNDLEKLVSKEFDLSELPTGMTMAPNGAFFRTDRQSVLSELMMEIYSTRRKVKSEMLRLEREIEDKGLSFKTDHPEEYVTMKGKVAALNNEQMALKIELNSGYGSLANKYFQFYDARVAEAITLSGQLSIKWIERKVNEYIGGLLKTKNQDYVAYVDTDGIYIELKDLTNSCYGGKLPDNNKVVDFLDKLAHEQIEPFIAKSYNELADYVHAFENKMVMKREVIASCVAPDTLIADTNETATDLFDSLNTDNSDVVHLDPGNMRTKTLTGSGGVYCISRKKYKGEMITFTQGNNSIKVTPEHIMFVVRDGKTIEVEAKKVIISDVLIMARDVKSVSYK